MTQYPRVLDLEDKQETAPALDVGPILAIHRDDDGYIGFGRKPDPSHPVLDRNGKPKAFENLCSIRAGDLRSMFPAFAEWLGYDGYFTVAAYYAAAPWSNRTTGLPDVRRKKKYLRSLPAVYSDIDCGRPESDDPGAALTWRQAWAEAGALADAGVIPQPSIMARSGRGVYLFYLLRDVKDPTRPPRAYPEKVQLYEACNRALHDRLRAHQLPADPIFDAARVLRAPGSINRKALRRVTYVIQAGDDGKGFVYTLPALAEALHIQAPYGELPEQARALAKPPRLRRIDKRGSAPRRSLGTSRRAALRAQDLLTIQQWRGSFLKKGMKYPDGHSSPGRRSILTMYADFLKGSKVDKAEALAALRDMARNMTPAYPSDPTDTDPKNLIEATYSTTGRIWGNKNLCKLLGITENIARELDLQTIRPPAVAMEADAARPTRAEYVLWRQEEVARKYLELHRYATTAQSLAKFYREQGIIGANRTTANQDLNAIGYKGGSQGGRPRKAL